MNRIELFLFRSRSRAEDPVELLQHGAGLRGKHFGRQARKRLVGLQIFGLEIRKGLDVPFDRRKISPRQGAGPGCERADALKIIQRLPRQRQQARASPGGA